MGYRKRQVLAFGAMARLIVTMSRVGKGKSAACCPLGSHRVAHYNLARVFLLGDRKQAAAEAQIAESLVLP